MSTITTITDPLELEVKDFNFYYAGKNEPNLKAVNMPIAQKKLDVPARKILMFKASKHTDIVV